jgi:hypothetical protein
METRAHFGQRVEPPPIPQRVEIPYDAFQQVRPHNAAQHDRPSLFLWLGALALPVIFGWYLLDWRYSSWTRIFGFSWSVFATGVLLISLILHPPPKSEVQVKLDAPTVQSVATTEESVQPESKWVRQYGDYYVTCYVTNGVRWYSAINQNNLYDAQINQTPSDDMWAVVCGGH